MQQTPETLKHAGDAASVAIVAGTLVDLLPSIAALTTILWTVIRIWETKTVQGWVAKLKSRFMSGA